MTTVKKKKPGRPAGKHHSPDNAAWRTALCATIARRLVEQYRVKVQHAIRAALKTMHEAAQDTQHWAVIKPAAVRQILHLQAAGEAVETNPSPGLLLRAAANLHATARQKA